MSLGSELLAMPIQYYVVSVLAILYSILIVFVYASKNGGFRKPFYKLWAISGVCGVITVLTQVIMKNHAWLQGEEAMYLIICILNSIGATGVAIGKVYVLINLYCLIRSDRIKVLARQDWSNRMIATLTLLLVFIGLIASTEFIFGTLHYSTMPDGSIAIAGLTDAFSTWSRIVSSVTYFSFIALSTIFSLLCVQCIRRFSMHTRKMSEATRQTILMKEKQLVIYAIVDCIVFGLKCLQQIAMLITTLMGDSSANAVVATMYVYVNGVAIFSSPLLLLIFSPPARRLAFPCIYGDAPITHVVTASASK